MLRGKFIEMYELLPEIWAESKEGEKPDSRARAKKRAQVNQGLGRELSS